MVLFALFNEDGVGLDTAVPGADYRTEAQPFWSGNAAKSTSFRSGVRMAREKS
jgi:hypothetical protein